MWASPPRGVSGRVLFQMATVGVCTGVVKIAGAAKLILVARAFGMSDGLDAYLIAFLLPSFVADTLSGSLGPALVPTFIDVREKQGGASAVRLYSSVLGGAVGWLTLVSLIFAAIAPWALRPLASSFDAAKLSLTVSLFLVMLPTAPLSALAMTWRAILNAEDRFVVAASAGLITPLISIAFLLRFGQAWGAYSLAAGTLAGGFLEMATLAAAIAQVGYPVWPRWSGRSGEVDQVLRQYAPLVAGTLLLGGAPLIDQAIAAMLGSGSVAALQYGTRLTAVLVAIGPTAVGTAILPHFSRLTAADESRAARRSLRGYATVILALTLPVVALLVFFSPQLIRVFFERGQFTGADTGLVAMVQRYSVLSIPVSMVLALVLRFISSVKQNDLLLRAAALAVVLNLAVDLVLGKWIGVKGIALSTAIVQSATVLYLIARLRAPLTFGTANIRTAGTPDSRRPEASLESESREGR
jgi:putative peptidoglycan lipid II flippase